jgi:cell division protein FtsB
MVMGMPVNLLRKQVASERRKRKLIFYTVIFLSFLYLFISLFFGDMGIIRYRELLKTQNQLSAEIKDIELENKQFRTQINLFKEDPFYMEKYAREEYGLAKPDEYIFQYDR